VPGRLNDELELGEATRYFTVLRMRDCLCPACTVFSLVALYMHTHQHVCDPR
jgi:hypothetical protein